MVKDSHLFRASEIDQGKTFVGNGVKRWVKSLRQSSNSPVHGQTNKIKDISPKNVQKLGDAIIGEEWTVKDQKKKTAN